MTKPITVTWTWEDLKVFVEYAAGDDKSPTDEEIKEQFEAWRRRFEDSMGQYCNELWQDAADDLVRKGADHA